MLDKAISIAVEAHRGQKLVNGEPFILHPFHVMNQMETEEEKIVAILHDVIEDTEITFEYLYTIFEFPISRALKALTHPHGEPYLAEYIERVAKNWLAINVKLEDLKHNMDISRLVGSDLSKTILDEHSFRDKIFEKYIPAYQILLQAKKDFYLPKEKEKKDEKIN